MRVRNSPLTIINNKSWDSADETQQRNHALSSNKSPCDQPPLCPQNTRTIRADKPTKATRQLSVRKSSILPLLIPLKAERSFLGKWSVARSDND